MDSANRDDPLIDALLEGDEDAFRTLVVSMQAGLLRAAEQHVASRAVAEDVVQETWLAVISGLARFERRSSLRTWIYRIATNTARTRGVREHRTVPFGNATEASDGAGPAVDSTRFGDAAAEYPGHWKVPPVAFDSLPEAALSARETTATIEDTIRALPTGQRNVIQLRDIEGWSASEVCDALDLTEANQRVLLHRARSRVRAALEATVEAIPS